MAMANALLLSRLSLSVRACAISAKEGWGPRTMQTVQRALDHSTENRPPNEHCGDRGVGVKLKLRRIGGDEHYGFTRYRPAQQLKYVTRE